jgi:hypothetical protein
MFMCVVNLKSVNKLDLTWKQSFLIIVNFFKMNLFRASLTPELQSVVAQQDQQTMTI